MLNVHLSETTELHQNNQTTLSNLADTKHEPFFPRCYDFSNSEDVKNFKEDYFSGRLLTLLKKSVAYFESSIVELEDKEYG